MVGAILLPYVSVVFANGGRESARDMPAPAPVPRPALEPALIRARTVRADTPE